MSFSPFYRWRKLRLGELSQPISDYTASKGEGLRFRAFAFAVFPSCFYRVKRNSLVSSSFGIITFYSHLALCFYKATGTYTHYCNPYIMPSTTTSTNLGGNHTKPHQNASGDLHTAHCIFPLAPPVVCSSPFSSSGVPSSRKPSLILPSSLVPSPPGISQNVLHALLLLLIII